MPIKYPIELEMSKLASWVREALRTHIAKGNILDEIYAYHLSMKPTFEAWKYTKMKAYRNHYMVIGDTNANIMATYDCGVVSVF
jgi:hypothetical protein